MKRRAASAPKAGGKKVKEEPTDASLAARPQISVQGTVDEHCNPSSGEVHKDYDCILILTNIKGNNNKVYIIQVRDENGLYCSCSRWARVGEKEKFKCHKFKDLESAIKDFETKFSKRTNTNWADRWNFESQPGKYTLIEVEGEQDAEDKLDHVKEDVQELYIKNLSKKQIDKGKDILEEIEDALNPNDKRDLKELSSKFYSTIPHIFGRKTPPTIHSKDIVQQKKKVLEDLKKLKSETKKAQEEMTVTVPHPVDQN
ncbi:protein mono-ADP-ribosyltransferase PARP3-like [Cyprinodon tularosa]|uniref:protein mono-ADP-ribosyltransferase PARP3-like n=1 Tax=Cyprinodon tularosa TaxID=77115 RepID=UPI0018E20747|nr:protein mono-ADP-ribosyltransferase PARP3-like [Cyprinodon tularosa]